MPVTPDAPDNIMWHPLTSHLFSRFARESPACRCTNNQRMDGRANAAFKWDIDYKAGHPNTGISAQERVLLQDWLDRGAPYL
jgi:hypothetical protein